MYGNMKHRKKKFSKFPPHTNPKKHNSTVPETTIPPENTNHTTGKPLPPTSHYPSPSTKSGPVLTTAAARTNTTVYRLDNNINQEITQTNKLRHQNNNLHHHHRKNKKQK